jgi:hypothetical protein
VYCISPGRSGTKFRVARWPKNGQVREQKRPKNTYSSINTSIYLGSGAKISFPIFEFCTFY